MLAKTSEIIMNELQNIEARYKRRTELVKSESIYFQYFAKSERELKYLEIINKYWKDDFKSCKILEIGAGSGDNLLFFHRLGISWQNIFANELLAERVCSLKENLKFSTIIGKNGQNDHLRPEQKDHPLAGAN